MLTDPFCSFREEISAGGQVGGPAVALGGRRVARLPGVLLVGTGRRWSARVREGIEPGERTGDHVGPRPVGLGAAAGGDRLGSGGEHRSRRRRGSHRRAAPVSANIGIQASRSSAIWTISSQTWFCAASCRGRSRRPVARAARMRSSARARWRWLSSSSAVGVLLLLRVGSACCAEASLIGGGAEGQFPHENSPHTLVIRESGKGCRLRCGMPLVE